MAVQISLNLNNIYTNFKKKCFEVNEKSLKSQIKGFTFVCLVDEFVLLIFKFVFCCICLIVCCFFVFVAVLCLQCFCCFLCELHCHNCDLTIVRQYQGLVWSGDKHCTKSCG